MAAIWTEIISNQIILQVFSLSNVIGVKWMKSKKCSAPREVQWGFDFTCFYFNTAMTSRTQFDYLEFDVFFFFWGGGSKQGM